MRWVIHVAVCAILAAGFLQLPAIAKDWSLSAMHGGPRSEVMYRSAPRWREAHETRQLRRRHHRPYRDTRWTDADSEIEYRMRDDRKRFGCVAERVKGLGTQWVGKAGALEAAKKDWMEHVRYYHGETFLDLDNADHFRARCSRVSIGEVVGQVTYRCEMVATPCKGDMLDGAEAAK